MYDLSEIKKSIDLLKYIQESTGQNATPLGKNMYRLHICPKCQHKDHFTIYSDKNSYSSFSGCCKGGTIFDYLVEIEDLDIKEATKKAAKIAGVKNDVQYESKGDENSIMDIQPVIENKIYDFTSLAICNTAIGSSGESYFLERGLNKDIIQSYSLGYTEDFNMLFKDYPELQTKIKSNIYKYIFPIMSIDEDSGKNYCNFMIIRADDKLLEEAQSKSTSFKYPKVLNTKTNKEFFNSRYIKHPESVTLTYNLLTYENIDTIFIVEGITDALSIEGVGYHSISLNSVKNVKSFIEFIKEHIDNAHKFKFKIACDNDTAGENANRQLLNALSELNLDVEEFFFNKKYHDVNDFLIKDKTGLVNLIKSDEEQSYNKGSDYEYIDDYVNKILTATKPSCVPTQFNKLNVALGGGLYPGIFVIGGLTGLGKTAIAVSIGSHLCKNGEDVIFISLEMSKDELMHRTISELTFKRNPEKCIPFTDFKNQLEISTNPEKRNALIEVSKDYKENYSKNRFIYDEGLLKITVSDIRNYIAEKIRQRNKKPVVVIDYLQKLYSEDYKDFNKDGENIAQIKQIAKDFDIPIIVISSLNRGSYYEPANLSGLKNSGDIEYTSDVIGICQFRGVREGKIKPENVPELLSKDCREIEIVFLKNRNYKPGIIVPFDMYSAYNCFEESEED